MKYCIIYIFAISILLYSCSGRSISQEKLPQIIAEMYLADKYMGQDMDRSSVSSIDSIRIYEAVFNKYGYTSEDYKRTIDKYISRPNKLKIYFENAKSILEEQKNSIKPRVAEHMRLDSLIGVYSRIISSNNSKDAYYKGVQTDKWIYFPYSDSRWPAQPTSIDITLPVEHNLFKIPSPNQSNRITPPWNPAHIPESIDSTDNIEMLEISDTQDIHDTHNTLDTPDTPDIQIIQDIPDENINIFIKYNRTGYPVWLFPSRTVTDTLRPGSSINQRVLFPNLLR